MGLSGVQGLGLHGVCLGFRVSGLGFRVYNKERERNVLTRTPDWSATQGAAAATSR